MIGAVSLTSSNNVVYLVESILIGVLILSLVFGSFIASSVHLEVRRKAVSALGTNRDQLKVTNRSRFPVFCVEVGEWSQGRFVAVGFIGAIPARSTVTLASNQEFRARGVHRWEGLVTASCYPFGFIRVMRVHLGAGERRVWPARAGHGHLLNASGADLSARMGGVPMPGEVRPMTTDDDYRSVVWTLSARGTDPVVRPRGTDRPTPGVSLDLRTQEGPGFEAEVSRAATELYVADQHGGGDAADAASLEIIDWNGRRKVYGRGRSLDELAVTRASVKAS